MAAPVIEFDPAAPLPDRAAAAAYVESICFKHGPPRLIGAELEWLVRSATDPAEPLDPARLLRALGPHAPGTLVASVSTGTVVPGPRSHPPDAPQPLPAGSTVTVEPGGQVEIATPPLEGLSALVASVRADTAAIRALLATEGLVLSARAADPLRPPRRILTVPRYAAMESAFDRVGPHGRTMMCSTSAVQVCLDAGEGSAVTDRWQALHELGPTLLATFANSPAVHGRRTGWKSSRMIAWMMLDPERTSAPTAPGPDPAQDWAQRALGTSLLCVPHGQSWAAPPAVSFGDWVDGRGGLDIRPTRADLDYHLTTLFPPVRPHGHVEVRYIDQQPGDEWAVPVAVVTALLSDPDTLDRARDAVGPARDRWTAAARYGLADGVLRRAAGTLVELAHQRLLSTDPDLAELVADVAERRVLRGLCPADEPVGEPGEVDLRSTEEHPYPDHPVPGGDHG